MKKNERGKFRRALIKYVPFIVAAIMLLHVLLLIHGIQPLLTEMAEVCVGFIVVWFFSREYGYCLLHRCFIYYSYLVTICIWWQRHSDNGFGSYLYYVRIIVAAIGIILFIILTVKRYIIPFGKECNKQIREYHERERAIQPDRGDGDHGRVSQG